MNLSHRLPILKLPAGFSFFLIFHSSLIPFSFTVNWQQGIWLQAMSRCPLTLTEIATVSNLTDCLSPLSHYKIIRAYWEKGEAFLDVMPHSNPHESGLKSSKMQQPLLGSKTEMYLYNGVQWRFKAGHNGSCMHCTLLVLNLRLVMVPGQSALSFFNRHPKHGSRSRVCNWDPTCNSCLKAFSCQSAKRRFQALGLVMVCLVGPL